MYDKHCSSVRYVVFLLFYDPPTTAFYTSCHTLALHDALPISMAAWLFAGHHRRPGAERVDGRPVLAREVGRAQQARRETLPDQPRSEEHTSELQSLMRNSYAVFCLKKKTTEANIDPPTITSTTRTFRIPKHRDKQKHTL